MTNLKPCPFCGGEACVSVDRIAWYVECSQCNTESGRYATEEHAMFAWNRRADGPTVPQEMTAREYLEAYQRLCNSHPLGECKNCPLFGYECPVSIRGVADELIDTITIVEKWASEHPEGVANE